MTHLEQLRTLLPSISCLGKYEYKGVLGQGSVGSVFLVVKNNVFYAAKLELIETEEQEHSYQKEIKYQQAFAPFAPNIIAHCLDVFPLFKVGAVVMELVVSTLDAVLAKPLRTNRLLEIVHDVKELLRFGQKNNLVHGDLALFNLGYVKREEGLQLVFMDFDSSSSLFDLFPKLDSLRLILELYKDLRSEFTAKINKRNERFLQQEAIAHWKQFGMLTKEEIAVENIDQNWTVMFSAYCKEANVLGLS
jgi:hypothetical protein